MKKTLLLILAAVVATLLILVMVYQTEIRRALFVNSLFTGEEQYETFNRIADLFPASTVTAAPRPHAFGEQIDLVLPETFSYLGNDVAVPTFIEETDTSALLVLKDGNVRYENYWLTGGREVPWLSMSVAKSFVSALVGIAVEDGLIDIETPISDYVPELADSAFDGVRVKDVLQMSSGAAWNEDYGDPDSDVNRMGRSMAFGTPLIEFVAQIQPENPPGTFNRYNSAETQALGFLLLATTQQPVTQYMQEKLWHPIGAESDAHWIIDDAGVELTFGGFNATARDYAKLGELFRLGGRWNGAQVVPEAWVHDSVTPDAPHLMPTANTDQGLGYGYQWWVPASTEGEFLAIGVYNQFIYVNPDRGVVIVKLSAFSDYATSGDASAYREVETIEFFREVVRMLN
ncbi:MAG: serine hydrolase [Pseudomonadota bacterium]